MADNAILNKFNRSHVLGLVASAHVVPSAIGFLPNSLIFN